MIRIKLWFLRRFLGLHPVGYTVDHDGNLPLGISRRILSDGKNFMYFDGKHLQQAAPDEVLYFLELSKVTERAYQSYFRFQRARTHV